jgi:hypothetical protein
MASNNREEILAERRRLSDEIFAATGKRPTAEELQEATGALQQQGIFMVPARGRRDGFEIVSEEMIKNGRASFKARRYYESQRDKS